MSSGDFSWSFSLRNSFAGYDSDSEEEKRTGNPLVHQLDNISSQLDDAEETTVVFKENPWTIAKFTQTVELET